MNIVITAAPISIENLKKFFTDKSTFYVINYKDSALKGSKLLTYLSNLDIPCDIDFTGTADEEFSAMITDYLKAKVLVNIRSLETIAMHLMFQRKGLTKLIDVDLVENNLDTLASWNNKIDSLIVYNMSTVKGAFESTVAEYPVDDTRELEGINFVSLLKNPDLYQTYDLVDNRTLKNYTSYFNDYMFKGRNMYSFWANENNPVFLLTYGIANGLCTRDQLETALKNTKEEMQDVAPIQ
jgi:hypothetical protein